MEPLPQPFCIDMMLQYQFGEKKDDQPEELTKILISPFDTFRQVCFKAQKVRDDKAAQGSSDTNTISAEPPLFPVYFHTNIILVFYTNNLSPSERSQFQQGSFNFVLYVLLTYLVL